MQWRASVIIAVTVKDATNARWPTAKSKQKRLRKMTSTLPSYTIESSRPECKPAENTASAMKINEYQAKAILAKFSVAVPRGEIAATREEAEIVARNLFNTGATAVVLKAQV